MNEFAFSKGQKVLPFKKKHTVRAMYDFGQGPEELAKSSHHDLAEAHRRVRTEVIHKHYMSDDPDFPIGRGEAEELHRDDVKHGLLEYKEE